MAIFTHNTYLRVKEVTPAKLAEMYRDGWALMQITFPEWQPSDQITSYVNRDINGTPVSIACNYNGLCQFSKLTQV